jgi:hypothetical protein
VLRQRLLELGSVSIRVEALAGAGVVRQFPAQVPVKRAVRQPREEVPGKQREAVAPCEARERLADPLQRRLKKGRQAAAQALRQALQQRRARQLSGILRPAALESLSFDRLVDAGQQFRNGRAAVPIDPEPLQRVLESRRPCREWQLHQKACLILEKRIIRSAAEVGFRRLGRGCTS